MGKAKGGKSKGFVSAGVHSNVSRATKIATKNNVSQAERVTNKMKAYWAGKNPWITIENPSKEQTNKRFIRVKANDLYGTPKERMAFDKKKSA